MCAQPMPSDLVGTLYADSQMVEVYNKLRTSLLKCSVLDHFHIIS